MQGYVQSIPQLLKTHVRHQCKLMCCSVHAGKPPCWQQFLILRHTDRSQVFCTPETKCGALQQQPAAMIICSGLSALLHDHDLHVSLQPLLDNLSQLHSVPRGFTETCLLLFCLLRNPLVSWRNTKVRKTKSHYVVVLNGIKLPINASIQEVTSA